MTANQDLQRRLTDFYSREPLMRAPDWVLGSALSTIESRRQRRDLLAPWRFARMTTGMKMASAAALLVAVGAFAVWQFMPAPSGPGGPTTAPTPTAAPTLAPTTAGTPAPTPYVPPELTETFTSDMHGISISYPAGWIARPATEPWTTGGEPKASDSFGDHLLDPRLGDQMFLTLASQPLGDRSFDAWADPSGRIGDLCTEPEPIIVDGADGVRCNFIVLVSSGGRGYIIQLRKSDDEPELRAFDATDWFNDVLATVQLAPEDALD